jgi:hypothetical protein
LYRKIAKTKEKNVEMEEEKKSKKKEEKKEESNRGKK